MAKEDLVEVLVPKLLEVFTRDCSAGELSKTEERTIRPIRRTFVAKGRASSRLPFCVPSLIARGSAPELLNNPRLFERFPPH